MTESVVIAGALAQKPNQGGHSWQFLQYLLGFKRLGWDVLFVDSLDDGMCVDECGRPAPFEQSVNLSYFLKVIQGFGLDDSFALLNDRGPGAGIPRSQVIERVRESAFLLNVMGYLKDEEILAAARRRVFLDTDPGYGQMWRDLDLADMFAGHDDYVTIGENVGRRDCAIPTCGLKWLTWRQPVVLDLWPVAQETETSNCFTSVGSWRGPYTPIEYKDRTYGLRVHEFRKFMALPSLTGSEFELALEIDPADRRDIQRLKANGWSLVDPRVVAADPWVYQAYIQRSFAELMVARNIYVDTNSGWFSERSICYLASGRPVLVQDTGIRDLLPTGRGIVAFTTLTDAVEGAREIAHDYQRHQRAAREIAEAYFDSDKVIGDLLQGLESRREESRSGR